MGCLDNVIEEACELRCFEIACEVRCNGCFWVTSVGEDVVVTVSVIARCASKISLCFGTVLAGFGNPLGEGEIGGAARITEMRTAFAVLPVLSRFKISDPRRGTGPSLVLVDDTLSWVAGFLYEVGRENDVVTYSVLVHEGINLAVEYDHHT